MNDDAAATEGQPARSPQAPDHYERHHDDEYVDEVRIRIIPRFKTSEASGDEWRVSAVTELRRKGVIMHERSYHNIEAAAAHLPWLLMTWTEGDGIPTAQLRADDALCHQPGCENAAIVVYEIKTIYDGRRGFPEPAERKYGRSLRAFCARHARRGDADLEDSDQNYSLVSGDSTAKPVASDAAPAVFGGVVKL